jgi:hypothetical protein
MLIIREQKREITFKVPNGLSTEPVVCFSVTHLFRPLSKDGLFVQAEVLDIPGPEIVRLTVTSRKAGKDSPYGMVDTRVGDLVRLNLKISKGLVVAELKHPSLPEDGAKHHYGHSRCNWLWLSKSWAF